MYGCFRITNTTKLPQMTTWHVLVQWSNQGKPHHNHLWKVLPKHSEHLWQKLPAKYSRVQQTHFNIGRPVVKAQGGGVPSGQTTPLPRRYKVTFPPTVQALSSSFLACNSRLRSANAPYVDIILHRGRF